LFSFKNCGIGMREIHTTARRILPERMVGMVVERKDHDQD
jgi:hypothetical protein